MALTSIVKVEVVAAPLYTLLSVAAALRGVNITRGAVPNGTLNVTVASKPVNVQPVPVVTVTVPDVSLPTMLTVGVVQAPTSATTVGVVPPVTMWPLTVMLVLTTRLVTVMIEAVVSAVNKLAPAEFWIWKAVVEFADFLKIDWPVAVRVPLVLMVPRVEVPETDSVLLAVNAPLTVSVLEAVSAPLTLSAPEMPP